MMSIANKKLIWLATIATCALSLLCSGCGANYQKYLQEQEVYTAKSYSLSPFSAITVQGRAAVELSKGAPYVSFGGKKKELDAANVTTVVKNDVLYVHSFTSLPTTIKLHANSINNITVKNHASLVGKDFTAQNLEIMASGHGAITFNNNSRLGVTHIQQGGNGDLDIKWIDSKELVVESTRAGQVSLAGVVDTLHAALANNAHVDSRYLRAQRANIFTTDNARADVLAIQKLNAYADKNSSVCYYKRPKKLNKVSKDSGNILLIDELR